MSESMPRRNFLQRAAATTLATGSTLLTTQRVRGQASSANDTVVVGVMGLSRGKGLALGFARQPNVHVKYVCDVDRLRAESGAAAIGEISDRPVKPLQDFRQILDDPDVDALVCAAPNHWHATATLLGCAAGKHVYVEKPCSHTPQEGELMMEAAVRHRRVVQLGTQRRSSPGTRQAMQRLADGEIGQVYLAKSWYYNRRGSIGNGQPAAPPAELNYDLWQGPAPRRPYLDNVVHYNWHWRWHWGNGELGNNGVHTIDLCRWGLQVDYPIHVTSSGGRFHYHDDQETPDTHTVCFLFDNGRAITWEGHSCNQHGSGFVTFYGTGGTLELDSDGNHRVYDLNEQLLTEVTDSSLGESQHFENFLAAIRGGDPSLLHAPIDEGHRSTLLCHLGNISHRTGRSLKCDPTNGHILDDNDAMKHWRREYETGWEPQV